MTKREAQQTQLSQLSCLACGDVRTPAGPCVNCGFDPPARASVEAFHLAIEVRDATLRALQRGQHWLNQPPFNNRIVRGRNATDPRL